MRTLKKKKNPGLAGPEERIGKRSKFSIFDDLLRPGAC